MRMTYLEKSDRRAARMYRKAAEELLATGSIEGALEFYKNSAHYALRAIAWN